MQKQQTEQIELSPQRKIHYLAAAKACAWWLCWPRGENLISVRGYDGSKVVVTPQGSENRRASNRKKPPNTEEAAEERETRAENSSRPACAAVTVCDFGVCLFLVLLFCFWCFFFAIRRRRSPQQRAFLSRD